jgi:hypothetical protein
MQVPWYDAPPRRTSAIAELIDVFPTVADVMGVPLPANETFDGKSLVQVLQVAADSSFVPPPLRQWALSQFMRCPPEGAAPAEYWEGGTCLYVFVGGSRAVIGINSAGCICVHVAGSNRAGVQVVTRTY